jgi:hypothetical protein
MRQVVAVQVFVAERDLHTHETDSIISHAAYSGAGAFCFQGEEGG